MRTWILGPKMAQYLLLLIALLATNARLLAQEEQPEDELLGGFYYGVYGGGTVATQNWNNFQRNALMSYHAGIFVESLLPGSAGQQTSYLFALGYHKKGSSFRNMFVGGSTVPANEFHNLTLLGAFKKNYATGPEERDRLYFLLGLRAEYTLDYQLVGFGVEGVNRALLGVKLAGGYDLRLPDSGLGLRLEASVSPDITRQVFVPAGYSTGMNDQNGNPILSQEQKVYNLIFEVSAAVFIMQ
ncbi:hypothetical protein PPO43_09120 [Saprospira sp. CCB-QB6]|uniref:hypothetical protein n=1 Tax=Saprospira sp. CCB-QB6 TaxID=3023936 RepID=UPI002349111C|nr:hypothetical protein [Saprospira sp. CCB-QB6]WCL80137.1 hypothetical protein PPO43_09120 [Saprospira sp. CCB-QB6]